MSNKKILLKKHQSTHVLIKGELKFITFKLHQRVRNRYTFVFRSNVKFPIRQTIQKFIWITIMGSFQSNPHMKNPSWFTKTKPIV